jgi:hypothetical protein
MIGHVNLGDAFIDDSLDWLPAQQPDGLDSMVSLPVSLRLQLVAQLQPLLAQLAAPLRTFFELVHQYRRIIGVDGLVVRGRRLGTVEGPNDPIQFDMPATIEEQPLPQLVHFLGFTLVGFLDQAIDPFFTRAVSSLTIACLADVQYVRNSLRSSCTFASAIHDVPVFEGDRILLQQLLLLLRAHLVFEGIHRRSRPSLGRPGSRRFLTIRMIGRELCRSCHGNRLAFNRRTRPPLPPKGAIRVEAST